MAHQVRNGQLLSFGAVVLAGVLTACNGLPPPESVESGSSTATLNSSSNAAAMVVYEPQGRIDDSNFVPFGSPEELGGRVIEGQPKLSGRIDYNDGVRAAGIFKATTGKIEVTFPFTEHATVLEGEVTITDASGRSHTFKPGDSYFIRQGQVITWEVKGKYVIKSFFNTVESSQAQ